MDRIESLVDRSAELAKLSFKPLLDNASEVSCTLLFRLAGIYYVYFIYFIDLMLG